MDILLGPAKLPSLRFLGFVTVRLSNLQTGISFVFQGSYHLHRLKILKLIPFCCLFARRIMGGQEETSTSPAGHKRGTPREMPIASSLVATMAIEELGTFIQFPFGISLHGCPNCKRGR